MNCYKGKTFCQYYQTCRHKNVCDRPLTEDIRKAAEDFGLPIAQWTAPPECYIEYEEKENDN